MKTGNLCGIVVLLVAGLGCGMFPSKKDEKPVEPTPAAATPTVTPIKTAMPDNTGRIEFPFEDFPPPGTTAAEGDYVLVPSFQRPLENDKIESATFIWYAHKMFRPGPEFSEIEFFSDKREVANAFLIPIPKGQTAKTGDILLTWWQTGSGMQRAIVTDASNPKEPVVRYLDIAYDNPAKSRGGDTTIGKMDEKLKPDTFVVLSKEMQPGTTVSIGDGKSAKNGQVIRISGDKLFAKLFTGKIGVFPVSALKGVPIVPKVKAGDKVRVALYSGFSEVTVKRVDPKIGRVFVTYGSPDNLKAIPFGDVLEGWESD